MAAPLAELHLHVYGTIAATDFLEHLGDKHVDWSLFEALYRDAYGKLPPIREVLERHRAGDPDAASDFERLFVFGDRDAGNFQRFQAKFNLMVNGSALHDHVVGGAPIERCVDEFAFFVARTAERHRQQGVRYAEQRMMLGRVSAETAGAFYAEALVQVAAHCDPQHTERLAISLPRADPWPHWEQVKRLALGPRGEALTGIDFCVVEEGFPPRDVAELFSDVRAFNAAHPERAIAILYHVGESFTDKSLESAIRWVQEAAELGAHRLGHAIALGVDPELYGPHARSERVDERRDQVRYDLAHAGGLARHGVHVDAEALARELAALAGEPDDAELEVVYDEARLHEVRARQGYAIERVKATAAVIEVCPTSNRRIGDISDARLHPLHRFVAEDVPFVVSSDDPGIFDTTLEAELDWVAGQVGTAVVERARERAWHVRSERLSGRERE